MNDIKYEEFKEIISASRSMNSDKLIELHTSLIDKNCINYSGNKSNCAIKFVYEILDYCWGKSIAMDYPKNYTKFFNSTYFSNYIKSFIKEKVNISTKSKLLQESINSDRNLNEFTEEEFFEINESLKEVGYSNLLTLLSFELDSKGAIDFLNNKVDSHTVIRRIITTSGLSDRPEYYSGRGAMLCDLNSNMLYLIYKKLARLDSNKGLNMVKMTLEMSTLGATEFLENLYSLAANNYDLEKIKLSSDNVSFGNSRGNSMFANGLASLASSLSSTRGDATPSIKECFINKIPEEVINNIDLQQIDFGNDYNDPWEYPKSYRRTR